MLRKVREILKGSFKGPFSYLRVISVILFLVFIFSFNTLCKSLHNQGDFSFLTASTKDLSEKTSQNPFIDPSRRPKIESPDFLLVQNNTLTAVSPPVMVTSQVLGALVGEEAAAETQKEIIEYVVKDGDNLWKIATEFNVSLETLIWANDLKSEVINPNQKLLVLPVSGVMHIVKEGDTISEIAKKYKAEPEKIIAFNDLSERDDIFVGEVLIIPGGKQPYESKIKPTTPRSLAELSTNNFYGQSHAYPKGYCTWWVAQKRAIPAWGDAKNWLKNAKASGFTVCEGKYCVPQVGAVICLKSSHPLGHVAYVEEVKGDKIVLSEMNYIGWGKMNYRTIKVGSSSIKGYIY